MTYTDFRRLRFAVADCKDLDEFIAEEGGSVDIDDLDTLLKTLEAIYTCRTIKDVRALTGLSQRAFSSAYSIPCVTLEQWEADKRVPPAYTAEMLLFAVLADTETL